jgi:transcriptional regulator with XRE-family HTH domain
MPTGDPPAVARRRVRLALREAREKKHLTQTEVAEAMEWSATKVMRIESGEVKVTLNDLRPLLAYLGISDPARVKELLDDARASARRQDWWDEPRFREHLTPATRQLIQYEVEATAVRIYYPTLIPGRLQTHDYADALLRAYGDMLSPETREIILEARMRRRKDLLARKQPPDIFLLLDESVLLREFAGAHVLSEQLSDLALLASQRPIHIRLVPFTLTGAPLALFGTYEILYLNNEEDAVLYIEEKLSDRIVESGAEIAKHRGMFDLLWNAALNEHSSMRVIKEQARALSNR